MKKVIRGRLYDTSTAQLIGETSGGSADRTNFEFWEEGLYKKKTGEYFLHCEGGALSKYAKHCGSNSGPGERIIPLTFEAAQQWAEKNLSGEHYIEEFGEPIEDYSKQKTMLNLTKLNVDKLKSYAAKNNYTISAVVDKLIEEHIK